MTLLHILAAALLHGLFEALPVATDSLDLLLFPFLSSQADGLALLVALWLGLATAMLLVNGRLLYGMGVGLVRQVKGRRDPGAALFAHVALASVVPVIIVLAVWKLGGLLLSPLWLLLLALGGGVLLLVADHLGVTVRRLEHLQWLDSLVLGGCAALGLIPGLGRVGPLVLAGRLLGYERPDILRLSWLILVPTLLLQAMLLVGQVAQQAQLIFSFDLFLAWLLCLLAALVMFRFSLGWVERRSLKLFLLCRLAFAVMALSAWWLHLI